jgi:NhaA family Na+:H+ antiporter
VRRTSVYAAFGLVLWVAFLKSGVHATIAGVLLALTIPARTRIDEYEFIDRARHHVDEFERASSPDTTVPTNGTQQSALSALEDACEGAQAPLQKLEHELHGVVAFAIMPVFALANAGVRIGGDMLGTLSTPVVLGVVLGLVLGKPIGIGLFSWLAVRSGLAVLPAGGSWRVLHGVSWLAGIGFTMSLFIAGLAFADAALLDSAKVGILGASVLAGGVGFALLRAGRATAPAAGAHEAAAETIGQSAGSNGAAP